ncbi:MAG: hypothetical protein PVI30_06865 [Myxococcales bacterium]|jgi:hypothetical protein
MSYTRLIISLPMLLSVTACIAPAGESQSDSPGDDTGSALQGPVAAETEIDGVWRTLCVATATGSLRREARFCDDRSYFIQYAYRDDHCGRLGSALEFEARIDSDYDTAAGDRELTQILTGVRFTPLDGAAVETMSATPTCDGRSWRIGRGMEPSPCMDAMREPAAVHSLFELEGDTLLLSTGSRHAPLELAIDEGSKPRAVPRARENRYYRKPGPPGFCDGSNRDGESPMASRPR